MEDDCSHSTGTHHHHRFDDGPLRRQRSLQQLTRISSSRRAYLKDNALYKFPFSHSAPHPSRARPSKLFVYCIKFNSCDHHHQWHPPLPSTTSSLAHVPPPTEPHGNFWLGESRICVSLSCLFCTYLALCSYTYPLGFSIFVHCPYIRNELLGHITLIFPLVSGERCSRHPCWWA